MVKMKRIPRWVRGRGPTESIAIRWNSLPTMGMVTIFTFVGRRGWLYCSTTVLDDVCKDPKPIVPLQDTSSCFPDSKILGQWNVVSKPQNDHAALLW